MGSTRFDKNDVLAREGQLPFKNTHFSLTGASFVLIFRASFLLVSDPQFVFECCVTVYIYGGPFKELMGLCR